MYVTHQDCPRCGQSMRGRKSRTCRKCDPEKDLGPGFALDGATRARMEGGFGTRLPETRIHTDARANAVASARGLRAPVHLFQAILVHGSRFSGRSIVWPGRHEQ